MQLIYSILITLMAFGLRVFSLFNEKVRLGVLGRKQSLSIAKKLNGEKVIWMHAASLGEYEQGLPVLEKLKEKYPNYKILITFFSPSGYENVAKKQHIADEICYLPFDRKKEIRAFVSQFQTEIFFTIKYDFWYHLLAELKRQGARTFVVSALFYERQIFFRPYGKWFVNQLNKNLDWIFHQTEKSYQLAQNIGLKNSSVSGDTRFDRVKQLRERDNFVPFIEEFKDNQKLVVFGSSWEAEEKIAEIIAKKSPNTKIIIAPHDVKRQLAISSKPYAISYSDLETRSLKPNAYGILHIDCIGLLSKLYSYADIAVVGGGFHSAGLHNILEAATFGKPVIFGNHYRKNPEADNLIAHNGGQSFANEEAAADFILQLLESPQLLEKMSENARDFINNQSNGTEIVLEKMMNI